MISCRKEVVFSYFSETLKDATGRVFTCIKCGTKTRVHNRSGYSNLESHITKAHPNFSTEYQQLLLQSQATIQFPVTAKAENLTSWFDWIIMDDLPINFCEKEKTRSYAKLQPICRNTFNKYRELLTIEVEKKISKELPPNFGLIFDGWSSHQTHFLAVFASFLDEKNDAKCRLLAFSPLVDETSLCADSNLDFISSMLSIYNKELKHVNFVVGDNCSTNKKVADKLAVPLVGCANHRCHLAVNRFIEENYGCLIEKTNNLMKKLSNMKAAAKLRSKTPLKAVMKNETRWLSVFKMVRRCILIQPFLLEGFEDLSEFLLSPHELKSLKILEEKLVDLESVTYELQKKVCNLAIVRTLFDGVMEEHPEMEHYLSTSAAIVHSPIFEQAVAKL